MDNLRFVLESPHIATTQKKRPRLVTSCDNCRLKKIKCVQSKSRDKCEACETGGVTCEFRDRERYFAERSRIVTAGSASAAESRRSSRSPPYPTHPSSFVSADTQGEWYPPSSAPDLHHSRYMSSSPVYGTESTSSSSGEWFSPMDHSGISSSSSYMSPPYNAITASGVPIQDSASCGYSDGLFDARLADFPDTSLMPYHIQVFFMHYSQTFPFLSSSDISNRFHSGTLSALLANAIAALAARHSRSPAVLERGSSAAMSAYCAMARSLISQSSFVPYVEILHSVILLAWAEYKCGRCTGFAEYTQMATKIAVSLGLGATPLPSSTSEVARNTQCKTWATILQLQQQLTTATLGQR